MLHFPFARNELTTSPQTRRSKSVIVSVMSEAHLDSLPSADAGMARFMIWRLKFKRAIETIDLASVPALWRDHVAVYQTAWSNAMRNHHPEPRTSARDAVRQWLRTRLAG